MDNLKVFLSGFFITIGGLDLLLLGSYLVLLGADPFAITIIVVFIFIFGALFILLLPSGARLSATCLLAASPSALIAGGASVFPFVSNLFMFYTIGILVAFAYFIPERVVLSSRAVSRYVVAVLSAVSFMGVFMHLVSSRQWLNIENSPNFVLSGVGSIQYEWRSPKNDWAGDRAAA